MASVTTECRPKPGQWLKGEAAAAAASHPLTGFSAPKPEALALLAALAALDNVCDHCHHGPLSPNREIRYWVFDPRFLTYKEAERELAGYSAEVLRAALAALPGTEVVPGVASATAEVPPSPVETEPLPSKLRDLLAMLLFCFEGEMDYREVCELVDDVRKSISEIETYHWPDEFSYLERPYNDNPHPDTFRDPGTFNPIPFGGRDYDVVLGYGRGRNTGYSSPNECTVTYKQWLEGQRSDLAPRRPRGYRQLLDSVRA
ncbi:MAG TPA: hypothetical protein VGH44_01765 [Candidatus Saccharimonadia bacterium]|jgi:hypothetical protein